MMKLRPAGTMFDPYNVTDRALYGTNLMNSPVYRDWLLTAIASYDGSDEDKAYIDTAYAVHRKVGHGPACLWDYCTSHAVLHGQNYM